MKCRRSRQRRLKRTCRIGLKQLVFAAKFTEQLHHLLCLLQLTRRAKHQHDAAALLKIEIVFFYQMRHQLTAEACQTLQPLLVQLETLQIALAGPAPQPAPHGGFNTRAK